MPRRATLARAYRSSELIDELVATYFPGPRSATGEDTVEFSCHGSPLILRNLVEAALQAGARLAKPGEFTLRAFLNGRLDLAQAEAVCELIRARTESSRRAALSQLQGGLSRRVRDLREPVFDLLVRVEASLDHPEEDLPSLERSEVLARLEYSRSAVSALAATFRQGRIVSEGARICIVGRPNAGKSSLLNALLGTERAIVCPEPGTTRDTLEEASDLGGIQSVLIDTAGLREECGDPAEVQGIERTRRALDSSDLALLVVDRSRPLSKEDKRVHLEILESAVRQGRPVVTVLNKSDLPPRLEDRPADAAISTLTGKGLQELITLIGSRLAQDLPGGRDPVLVTSLRHHQALLQAAAELGEARDAVRALPGRWEDRLAFHLRRTLQGLGEIVGEGAPDEVLEAVFSRFCVGK